MPIRKHKRFTRPRKMFDVNLIKEEQGLIKKYGLKNRREIWHANFEIEKIRNLAKKLITADEKKKNEFIQRQSEKGYPVTTISDVLALGKEDYLKRRLQSVVSVKKLVNTYKQARQLITHKHIRVNGKVITSPSHQTSLEEETGIETSVVLPKKEQITKEEKEILEKMKSKEAEE